MTHARQTLDSHPSERLGDLDPGQSQTASDLVKRVQQTAHDYDDAKVKNDSLILTLGRALVAFRAQFELSRGQTQANWEQTIRSEFGWSLNHWKQRKLLMEVAVVWSFHSDWFQGGISLRQFKSNKKQVVNEADKMFTAGRRRRHQRGNRKRQKQRVKCSQLLDALQRHHVPMTQSIYDEIQKYIVLNDDSDVGGSVAAPPRKQTKVHEQDQDQPQHDSSQQTNASVVDRVLQLVQPKLNALLRETLTQVLSHHPLLPPPPVPVDVSGVLHRDGYELHRHTFTIVDDWVNEAVQLSASDPKRIVLFNNTLDTNENDRKRIQLPLRRQHIPKLCQAVRGKLHRMFPNHRANDLVLLRSEPGCLAQIPHTDYASDDMPADNDFVPLAAVVALQDDTWFDVWPRSILGRPQPELCRVHQLTLNRGDMLVFRGDTIHCGSAFEKSNVRLHTYLDVAGGPQRQPDRTHLVDDTVYQR